MMTWSESGQPPRSRPGCSPRSRKNDPRRRRISGKRRRTSHSSPNASPPSDRRQPPSTDKIVTGIFSNGNASSPAQRQNAPEKPRFHKSAVNGQAAYRNVADVGITPTSHFHRGLTVRISFPPAASQQRTVPALGFEEPGRDSRSPSRSQGLDHRWRLLDASELKQKAAMMAAKPRKIAFWYHIPP